MCGAKLVLHPDLNLQGSCAHWCMLCWNIVAGQRCLLVSQRLFHPNAQGMMRCLNLRLLAPHGTHAQRSLREASFCLVQALMPVAVFVVGCAFGTEKYNGGTLVNMLIVSLGVAIASFGETSISRLLPWLLCVAVVTCCG